MAVQQVIDWASKYSASTPLQIDIGGWDFVVVQLVGPTGTTSFATSNDSGAIEGVSDGNAASATNFNAVTGTNLATGSGVTTLAAAGSVKFSGIGQYLQLSGGSATKVLVRYYKTF
jgi:hypothetical protein